MSEISAIDIRVNNLINPLGINGDAPEISWRIAGSIRQSAWRICAAGSIEAWEKGEFIWDFELPNGVCADVKMPDGTFKEFSGGTYTLEFS